MLNISSYLTKTKIIQKKLIEKHYFFQKFNFSNSTKSNRTEEKIGLLLTMENKAGVLAKFSKIFADNDVNLSYISSKPSKFLSKDKRLVDFFVDCEAKMGCKNLENALKELEKREISINILQSEQVPWFPKTKYDLNEIGREILAAGEQLSSDHPGFNDQVYRNRRDEIVSISNKYNMEDELNIPTVDYTEEEKEVWKFVWDKLIPLHKLHACEEVRDNMDKFIKEVGFSGDKIPQIKDISAYLLEKTGTIFRPVAGLLSQREFLNGLAFKVFHSTQYIRHKSVPLYTPEPDIIHEILGHSILFADKDFADFSQEIGLASLAASDDDIEKLGNIYWFTIEFGLCMQKDQRKIYGAGILSSPSEIEWAMSDKPTFHEFGLKKMGKFPYSITDIQTNYFMAPSFGEVKQEVVKYGENIKKAFNVSYNVSSGSIEVDRRIQVKKN